MNLRRRGNWEVSKSGLDSAHNKTSTRPAFILPGVKHSPRYAFANLAGRVYNKRHSLLGRYAGGVPGLPGSLASSKDEFCGAVTPRPARNHPSTGLRVIAR
jgi:hypothetical protein